MKIILTGGGTAGHVIPHIALLDELKNNFNFLKVFKIPNVDSDSLAKKKAGPRNGTKTL